MEKKFITLKKDVHNDKMPIAKIVNISDEKIRKDDAYIYVVDKYEIEDNADIHEMEKNKIADFYDYLRSKKISINDRDANKFENYILHGDSAFLSREQKEIVRIYEYEQEQKTNLRLTNYNKKFQILPSITAQNLRRTLFISGKSGSGKSYYTSKYLAYFNFYFKNSKIFVICENDINEDPAYSDIHNIVQLTKEEIVEIGNSEDIINYFYDKQNLQSIVVFDDIETYRKNKQMNEYFDKIKTSI